MYVHVSDGKSFLEGGLGAIDHHEFSDDDGDDSLVRGPESLHWLKNVWAAINRQKKAFVGHPEMLDFIKRHRHAAVKLGFPHCPTTGIPHDDVNDPLRIAYRRRFEEMTVTHPHHITEEEFVGFFGHGALFGGDRAQAREDRRKQVRAWFRQITHNGAYGQRHLTQHVLREFILEKPAAAMLMGFSTHRAAMVGQYFAAMDMEGNGRVSEDDFLAYFGFGSFDAKRDMESARDKVARAEGQVREHENLAYESDLRQQHLRKDGFRRMGRDGKMRLHGHFATPMAR